MAWLEVEYVVHSPGDVCEAREIAVAPIERMKRQRFNLCPEEAQGLRKRVDDRMPCARRSPLFR